MIKTSFNLKKQLALIATTVISVVVILTLISETTVAALTFSKSVNGYYKQLEARAIEYYMNRDRKSGDGYYIDSSGVKHAAAKDHDIAMDANLEAVARQRAAELVLHYSHVRPNGSGFDTLSVNGMRSYQEYIFQMPLAAAGKDSSLDAYANWFNVGRGPAGFSMMSSNFTASGCACFVYNGVEYWVLEFSIQPTNGALLPNIPTTNTSVNVDFTYETCPNTYKISIPNQSTTVGSFVNITGTVVTEYIGDYKVRDLELSTVTRKYTISDTNIAYLNSFDNIVGKNAGTVKVTCDCSISMSTEKKYIGSATFTLTVNKANISNTSCYIDNNYCSSFPSKEYTGQGIKQSFVVKDGSVVLKEGTDYSVSYSNNVNVGKATVTITGIGKNYTGTKTLNFTITAADISKATVSMPTSSFVYSRELHEPEPLVKWTNGAVLKNGVDYKCRYELSQPVGTSRITITGTGNFQGTTYATFTITPLDITNADIEVSGKDIYTGSAITPRYSLLWPNTTNVYLTSANYTATITNNVNAGTATITLVGKGNCKGTTSTTFVIEPKSIESRVILSHDKYITYTGSEIKPTIAPIVIDGITLKPGVDYDVTYTDNINPGKATIVVKGKGNYTGTVSSVFTINKIDMSSAVVTGYQDHVDIGSRIIFPNIVVTLDGQVLREGIEYNLVYSANDRPGEAFVRAYGINNYSGTVTKYFTISTSTEQTRGVAAFVERLYTVTLNRDFDPVGKLTWFDAIINGADGASTAYGFFFSEELTSQNLSNEEFVTRLYRTLMDREPDQAGFNTWVNALKKGATRESVFLGFVNSTEWADICLKYGIKSGGTGTPSIKIDPNNKIMAFVERLYTTCLCRNPDPTGMETWSYALANIQQTGASTAFGFFFSNEFISQNLPDEEYVSRLYSTFLDRSPDAAGLNTWLTELRNGASRETVFYGFAKSAEFIRICQEAGIVPF